MRDLSDTEIGHLDEMLAGLVTAAPEGGPPLEVSSLDGYLCGVLLQPEPVAEHDWLRLLADEPALPPTLLALVRQRHAFLAQAIERRLWFDPWIFEFDAPAAEARDVVLPWVTGFSLATERFPALTRLDEGELAEPLALLYRHFDTADLEGLEDEPALAAALAETEPAADLAEAVEDLVRAVLLLADISRPARAAAPRTAPAHASPAPAPRSKSARRARARRG